MHAKFRVVFCLMYDPNIVEIVRIDKIVVRKNKTKIWLRIRSEWGSECTFFYSYGLVNSDIHECFTLCSFFFRLIFGHFGSILFWQSLVLSIFHEWRLIFNRHLFFCIHKIFEKSLVNLDIRWLLVSGITRNNAHQKMPKTKEQNRLWPSISASNRWYFLCVSLYSFQL